MGQVNRVGVVGCGLMGSGIAEVTARAGVDVVVVEASPEAAEGGRARIVKSLDRALHAGKLSEHDRDIALGHLDVTVERDALADREIVIEAVIEQESEKLDVFRWLDQVVKDDHAVLASNTSSIPIMKLGMATARPSQVVGLHFFNPVPVLRLVELVSSLLTTEETVATAERFATDQLGKTSIRSQDRAGFVVNSLLVPYLLSAIRMVESGFATCEHIDEGMVLGCAHPMGPLAVTDLIGLDTTMAVAESLYDEFKEPLYAPPPLLARMVEGGLLGRKSGRGFYEYPRP
ncbi:MAG: 3-hydroxybutyryl-CoA dehydrogenase [Acidimicrobiia bacterium]